MTVVVTGVAGRSGMSHAAAPAEAQGGGMQSHAAVMIGDAAAAGQQAGAEPRIEAEVESVDAARGCYLQLAWLVAFNFDGLQRVTASHCVLMNMQQMPSTELFIGRCTQGLHSPPGRWRVADLHGLGQ